ncbi:hypothetical protein NE626_16600, partial [Intestinimonas massiliensis]
HEVIFAGRDEVIELRHSAQSREIFASGALRAARFLARAWRTLTPRDILAERKMGMAVAADSISAIGVSLKPVVHSTRGSLLAVQKARRGVRAAVL